MFSYLRFVHESKPICQLIHQRWIATKPALQWPLDPDKKLSSSLHEIESYWNGKLMTASVGDEINKEKKYILSMFPYPSGMLHMGHMRVYSISDVLCRYYKLNGFNVIHPIGWDAFGLPAENAAIEKGIDPKEWTYSNAAAMKQQLLRTGVQFDWDRELYTCDPTYFKWTQWIFLKLFEADMVHRTVAEVNWDPIDQTVLADEQIDGHGNSWRSGAKAEKRKLAQWMIETPKYAKRLLDGLEVLKNSWKEVADIQANWIGKCDVWRFVLRLKEGRNHRDYERFDLRLKDPTELVDAQFLIIERDHPLAKELSELPKTTTVLGPTVTNFITGKQLPVVVLSEELATQDTENKIEYVMKARIGTNSDEEAMKLLKLKPITTKNDVKIEEIIALAKKNGCAGYLTSRTLNDWVVSRQRSWGCPIPMALTKNGESFPVTTEHLPILLEHRGQEFQSEGKIGILEQETLDTFFDSSWYYLRYLDPKNEKEFVKKELTTKYMPVDVYIGGVEHAAVHMFFARFMSYFLYDNGLITHAEPFKDLVPQGIVRARTFIDSETGKYFKPNEIEQSSEGETFVNSSTGDVVESTYEKMSKSKHNGIDPINVIEKDGVDMARLQLLDAASPRANLDWGIQDLKGLKTWIDRISWIVNAYINGRNDADKNDIAPAEIEKQYKENYNFFVRNTSMLLEVLRVHNTAISRLQGLTNSLRKIDLNYAGKSREFERCVHSLVIMLQVFAPNTSAELWSALCQVEPIDTKFCNHDEDVFKQKWPIIDHDSEIDFIITAMELNCGRAEIDRREIEDLSDSELVQLARNKLHSLFFTELSKAGRTIEDFTITKRKGLHITMDLKMKNDVTETHIKKVLDKVTKIKFKDAKKSKKEMTKQKATA
uniref:Leucine--tRNA ligase n=2 Tax=Panagrolaimus sp. JU765 TaxID=591449 RepID=A0AC34R3Z9_9BILA